MMKKWGLLRFRRKRNAAGFCFSTHIRLKRNRNFYSPVSLLMIFNRFHHSLWVCRLFEDLNSSGFQPDKVHFVEMRGFFKNGVDVSIAYKIFGTRVIRHNSAAITLAQNG